MPLTVALSLLSLLLSLQFVLVNCQIGGFPKISYSECRLKCLKGEAMVETDQPEFPTSQSTSASTSESLSSAPPETESTTQSTTTTATTQTTTTTTFNENGTAADLLSTESTAVGMSSVDVSVVETASTPPMAMVASLEPIRTKRDAPRLHKAKDAEQCEYECKVLVKQPLVCHSCHDEKKCGRSQDLSSLDGTFELCKPNEACWTVYQAPTDPQVPDYGSRQTNSTEKFGFFRGCLGRSGNDFRLHCHQHSLEFCFGDHKRSVCAVCCEQHGCNNLPLTFVSQTRNDSTNRHRFPILLTLFMSSLYSLV